MTRGISHTPSSRRETRGAWPMTPNRTTPTTAVFLLRYSVECLTILAILFILQSGLVPFDLTAESSTPGTRTLFDTRTSDATFPDLVSNIFLYVPLGALAYLSLRRILSIRVLAWPGAVVSCLLISGSIEWLQAYSDSRVSSLVDLVANGVGGALGASLSSVGRRFIPSILGAALHEFHERPASAILKSYCVVMIVFAVLPFSFTLDASRLKQVAKAASFVPFGEIHKDKILSEASRAAGDYEGLAHHQWRRMQRWSRWAAEAASFVVLVWLTRHVLRRVYRFSRRATLLLVLWFCGVFAIVLSVLQFTVLTRGFDVTDILFRLVGMAFALLVYPVYLRPGGRGIGDIPDDRWRRLAYIGCVGAAAYIVYAGTIPLMFGETEGAALAAVTSDSFLPFMAYFVTRFDVMMTDVMEKFASNAVFAALLATCWVRVRRLSFGERLGYILPVCLTLSVATEAIQMFIPVRVATLSDPMLACVGCVVGVVAQQHGAAFYRFASTHDVLGADPLRKSESRRGLHTLTDTLVASLVNPDEHAPAESVPRRRPVPQRDSR